MATSPLLPGPDPALEALWQWFHHGPHAAHRPEEDHLHWRSATPTQGCRAGGHLQLQIWKCVLCRDRLWPRAQIPQGWVSQSVSQSVSVSRWSVWLNYKRWSSYNYYVAGAGRVTFSSRVSFMSAVSCRFLQVTYGDIDKKVYWYWYSTCQWWREWFCSQYPASSPLFTSSCGCVSKGVTADPHVGPVDHG